MGKVSNEARTKYLEKSKEYKEKILAILDKEKKSTALLKGADPDSRLLSLELADENLNIVSYYVLLNSLSITLLGVKNEAYLNDARKCCYKAIIYMEEVVSNYIDVPFSEYEDRLKSIEIFDDIKRYNLVRKLGYSIQSIIDEFGANSKWKWSFAELEGRFAVVSKNLIDLKSIVSKLDPRITGYPERMNFIEITKRLLASAADKYREKYELSTRRLDDIKLAINYLSALKRLLTLIGQNQQVEMIKKKIEVWNLKMENDFKKIEESKQGKVGE